jgi:hypothetical protein
MHLNERTITTKPEWTPFAYGDRPPEPSQSRERLPFSGQTRTSEILCLRKLNPAILVMQSAEDWATKNAPGAIDGARDRRIFVQG